MTRAEVYKMVKDIGLPCAYYQFADNTPQVAPFIVWFFLRNTDVIADNENYVDKEVLNIELYTKQRDFDKEADVEAALKSYGFVYAKEASFVDSERIWQISYESEVIING